MQSARHPRVALTILVVLLGFAGLESIPPVDRDEPQFAQPARQMLESHDFIDIRLQRAPFYEKPILTYWLQAGAAALFSRSAERNEIWTYRLPSVLGVLIATLLTYELGLVLFERRSALHAAALLASMLLVQTQAHQARADALLLASTVGAVLPLAHAYSAKNIAARSATIPSAALFWISIAAAILIKGPVVPCLIVLACASLAFFERPRWLSALHPRWGVPLLLLLLLPWPIAMLHSHGCAFFIAAWRADILPKLISAQESHGAPPLSYLFASPLLLWPATLLLPRCVEFAWCNRHVRAVRFCAALILPGWLLFEFAPTKLPHYVLPMCPLLVMLMSASGESPGWSPSKFSLRLGVALFAIVGLALAAAIACAFVTLDGGLDVTAIVCTLICIAAVLLTAAFTWRDGLARSVQSLVACGAVISLVIFGFMLPQLERLWVADRAARIVQSLHSTTPALVVGYHEPSLVFLLGTPTRFVSAQRAAQILKDGTSEVAVVRNDDVAQFEQTARSIGVEVKRLATVEGIDPVHGAPIRLDVWESDQ